jgi:hypothetical protein
VFRLVSVDIHQHLTSLTSKQMKELWSEINKERNGPRVVDALANTMPHMTKVDDYLEQVGARCSAAHSHMQELVMSGLQRLMMADEEGVMVKKVKSYVQGISLVKQKSNEMQTRDDAERIANETERLAKLESERIASERLAKIEADRLASASSAGRSSGLFSWF